jgi:hypothetical protein
MGMRPSIIVWPGWRRKAAVRMNLIGLKKIGKGWKGVERGQIYF